MTPELTMGRAGDITHCDWIVKRHGVRGHVRLAALRQPYASDAWLKFQAHTSNAPTNFPESCPIVFTLMLRFLPPPAGSTSGWTKAGRIDVSNLKVPSKVGC